MTDKPPEDEKPDDAAFQRTLENMLKAPPKPHKTKEEADDARKPASPKR
ncbi:MAG: hypothetical protein WCY15_12865 [Phenylobacterium sp.]|jgi:hypothetical protein|nr:hypothetical protein [Phenylobacterium sp.]MDX9998600.1 hypothetical protein [Phenylobacterium sp.]